MKQKNSKNSKRFRKLRKLHTISPLRGIRGFFDQSINLFERHRVILDAANTKIMCILQYSNKAIVECFQ